VSPHEAHIRLLQTLPVRTHTQRPPVKPPSPLVRKSTARVRTLKQTSKLRGRVVALFERGFNTVQIGRRLKISRQLAYYLLK
jgi:hypothetical protein